MSTTDPAALTTPVLLAPRALDGALADRLMERAAVRLTGGSGDGGGAGATLPRRPANAMRPGDTPPSAPSRGANGPPQSGDLLSEGERAMVDALKARDREVRAHEEAHARVGGRYAGEPSYTYQQGPDGGRYAVGGSVAIDVAPVDGDPEATIAKMAVVRAAALAPAEPSASDRRVAAIAEAETRRAVSELARQTALAPTGAAGPSESAAPEGDLGGGEPGQKTAFDLAATRFLDSLRALLEAVDADALIDRSA
ncbi:MAG: putative metalloprotease CJM1_0395 family protein [Pseudomonadota bacterium]